MAPSIRRAVERRTVVSDGQPAVVVEVAAGFACVGRLEFTLHDVARVDAFVFAAGDARQAGRLLVVQFERYLESNDHTYAYSFAQTVPLGGQRFHTDAALVELTPPPPRESDLGRVLDLLRRHGYRPADRAAVVRFVHLPDAERRTELLILYAEPGIEGAMDARFEQALRERALACFALRFADPA